MGRFRATFTVEADPAAAVAYLADYAQTVAWDPGTVRCTRLGGGPLEVGARWSNVSEFRGRDTELTYTLVESSATRVRFEGVGAAARTHDDFTVTPAGGGSSIAYDAGIALRGWRVVADPFLRRVYDRMGLGAVDGLTAQLRQHPSR